MTERTSGESLEQRVPWPALIAYGMGGLIPIALFNASGRLMQMLGNISLGLSAFWLGVILIIPRLWDAVSDPIMGHLTDNTRTRWGRRRPYILLGGIAAAVTFSTMWWVPRGEAFIALFSSELAYDRFQFLFILAGLLLFFTACTIFEIPHGALGMELSEDYHERTRLFSAKSFLGNLFAMGTPWLIALASLEFFRGPGGDLIDGMRGVSLVVAAVLVPIVVWCFFVLEEPGFRVAQQQEKSPFWQDMRTALSNRTFLKLVVIIFTLAMGFNFVGLFNDYITIFYLYGGDVSAAATLLGLNGTVWAVTALVAVFPLNWLSRRWGKSNTLLIAILLMCAAQLSKIVCYNPDYPKLILLPTILLSSGMLMFFTLGSSMVGDICDEDELHTGTRSEGSYYSVFWWFIKMGTAFASFVTGALLVFTDFDETQNVTVDSLRGAIEVIQADAEAWKTEPFDAARSDQLEQQLQEATQQIESLNDHLQNRLATEVYDLEHAKQLATDLRILDEMLEELRVRQSSLIEAPDQLRDMAEQAYSKTLSLKRQSPVTLLRLRIVEIGVPLLLSVLSIWLTLGYPLIESRCYEIKEQLQERRAASSAAAPNSDSDKV